MARTWRKEKKGSSWRLDAGRGAERIRLTLGPVSEADAERARLAMQDLELAPPDATITANALLILAKQDREKAVAYLLDEIDEDLFGPPPVDYAAMRLQDYVRDVWTEVRSTTRPASWRTEEGHWKRINEALGSYRLRELASPDGAVVIDEYLTGLRRLDGRPAAAGYVRQHRKALRALLIYARRKNHIKALPEFFRLESNPENQGFGPSETLTEEERRKLIEGEEDPKLRALWTVATYLGCRPSENCRMRWEDVEWDAEGRGYRGVIFIRGTKTEASKARVPLLGPCRAALLEWHMKAGRPEEGFIFPSRGSEPYAATSTYKKSLKAACERVGITKKITPYSLRHTAATIAKRRGVSTDSVAKLLRHSNPRMVEQRYDHTGATDLPDLELLNER